MSLRRLAALALIACAPAPRPAADEPVLAPSGEVPRIAAEPPPAELAALVEPWHAFDRTLADASPVWLLTRYRPGTYPCIEGPDGELDMLQQDRFEIEQVLRGPVVAKGVDLDLYSLRAIEAPRAFAEGRRYLLFLRPGPKAQAQLADPKALGGIDRRLGAADVAHVVDVDQSHDEARAEAVVARHVGGGAQQFDPSMWAELRSAAAPDPARQRPLAAFLRDRVLLRGAALAEVRGWLGAPDSQDLGPGKARRDRYILARPAHDTPTLGAIYGDLELRFDDRLRLRSAELEYLRWHARPHGRSSVALTPDEHAAEGLPRFELRWD
jgi:hypothetical protein